MPLCPSQYGYCTALGNGERAATMDMLDGAKVDTILETDIVVPSEQLTNLVDQRTVTSTRSHRAITKLIGVPGGK